ncbi:hypothetical protein BDR04DRAFT_1162619 [Suillus decipiens]|nr:hypothetical protein BDR04DRAFT_1162619 [Suillus decipiens]
MSTELFMLPETPQMQHHKPLFSNLLEPTDTPYLPGLQRTHNGRADSLSPFLDGLSKQTSTSSGHCSSYDDGMAAYMRMHQQIQALVSENETLKQQNNVLLASQDAYKNAFKILATSISLDVSDSDIAKFSGIPPGFKCAIYKPSVHERKHSEPLHQSAYPNTRFWTPSLYETWKKSPDAQYTEHGTFPFLENADGKPVEKSEVTRITKSLQSCWAALKQENRAPDTWGKAGNKILDEVAEEMAQQYPSWTATHLDKKKRKVHNTGFNDHDTSKQRKVSGSSEPESDASNSRITGDKSISTLSESEAKQDTPPKDVTMTSILNFQKSDIGTSKQEQQSNDTQPQSIEVSTPSLQPGPVSLPVPHVSLITTTHDAGNSPTASSHANTADTTPQDRLDHSNDTVNTSTCITEDTETHVEVTFATMASFPVIKNPLAKLAGQKRESTVPDPVVTPSDMPAPLSTPMLPSNKMPAPPASATVESAGTKKFRPGTSKNGRSLCAHRWLKQVAPNGSSANFRIYWSGLTKEKQLAYETDALKLVKDDIWNGNTVDIISKISSSTLH